MEHFAVLLTVYQFGRYEGGSVLADAVQFQPTLYRLITNLATREEFTQMQTDQKMQIYQVLGRHTKDVENQLQRDGKAREKFSTDLSKKLSANLQDLDRAKESLERTCRKWVLITAGSGRVFPHRRKEKAPNRIRKHGCQFSTGKRKPFEDYLDGASVI